MNKVQLMGRLTKDPDTRLTPGGTQLTRFTIAVNRRFASKDAQQTADFINCVAWRKTGEFVNRYFRKGNMIAIVGHMQSDSWEDKDGQRRFSMTVVADKVYFTGSKSETHSTGHTAEHEVPSRDIPEYGSSNTEEEYPEFEGAEDDLPY